MNWGPLDLQSNALPLSYTPIESYTLQKERAAPICYVQLLYLVFTSRGAPAHTIIVSGLSGSVVVLPVLIHSF